MGIRSHMIIHYDRINLSSLVTYRDRRAQLLSRTLSHETARGGQLLLTMKGPESLNVCRETLRQRQGGAPGWSTCHYAGPHTVRAGHGRGVRDRAALCPQRVVTGPDDSLPLQCLAAMFGIHSSGCGPQLAGTHSNQSLSPASKTQTGSVVALTRV